MTLTRAEALAAEHDAFQNAFASVDLDTNIRNFSRRGDIYVTDRIQAMWEGWQKRAAHFAAEPAEWMPIESAPRDGTRFIVWRKDGTFSSASQTRYTSVSDDCTHWMIPAAPTGGEG